MTYLSLRRDLDVFLLFSLTENHANEDSKPCPYRSGRYMVTPLTPYATR